jgi:hypothetical protein
MNGPRVGAASITDKFGNHYMSCPACTGSGCLACARSGRILTHPIHPAPSYIPGTYIAAASVPGHINHVAPATLPDRERTLQVDIDGDGIIPPLNLL